MKVHELIVYLVTNDAAKAIQFYQKAFGAKERYRLVEPDDRIDHAELEIGEAEFYISDSPDKAVQEPDQAISGKFVIHLHVDNADECIASAVNAGATVIRAPEDQFYGERSGTIRDPFGYDWLIGHSIEDVSPGEMQKRYNALFE